MQSKTLVIHLTPFETSQLMRLKELVGQNGIRHSTSQTIAVAVEVALRRLSK